MQRRPATLASVALAVALPTFAATTRVAQAADPSAAMTEPAGPATTATDAPPPAPAATATSEQAERAAIVAKGKRLSRVSIGFTAAGLGLTFGSILVGDHNDYITAVTLASGGVLLTGTAVGLAIAGMRRTKHPERFMSRHRVALTPVATRRLTGAALSFRF